MVRRGVSRPSLPLARTRATARRRAPVGSTPAALVLLALAALAGAGRAHAGGETPVWTRDTPIGPLAYRPGQGLQVGDTGLNVGGFTSLELERPDGEAGDVAWDGVSFLVLLEPPDLPLRAFGQVEIENLLGDDTRPRRITPAADGAGPDGEGEDPAEAFEEVRDPDPRVEVERLYAELTLGEPLRLRFGQFLTPIGRWNPVPLEPFVWTASEPVGLELAFEDTQLGAMLTGSFHPELGTLSYAVYGQFLEHLTDDDLEEGDLRPSEHSVGLRVDLSEALDTWSIGLSALGSEEDGEWYGAGGVDAQVATGPLELTAELTLAHADDRGPFAERRLWDVYVQAVYELLPGFHLVGRYEHLDPQGSRADPDEERSLDLADLGVAWLPVPHVALKADYRVVDRSSDDVPRGLSASLSVIF